MSDHSAAAKAHALPAVVKYTDIRSYIITAVFISLAVVTPWLFHQFHLAGAAFLPMHIFVFAAGLLFGWRAGLAVGLFTPLVSYALSGMPVIQILPQTVLEISVYGLAAGILREKLKLPVLWSLIGAMLAGRLALLLTAALIQSIGGEIYSPLGVATDPLSVLYSSIALGWRGIVIQLALIPIIVKLLDRKRNEI